MNQAINLIDKMIEEKNMIYFHYEHIDLLREVKDRISSLPSDTQWIDTLQRYTNTTDDGMEVSTNGYWVSYKDVYDLPRS